MADPLVMGPYDIGDEVTMEGTFKTLDAGGVYQLANPAPPVVCKVRKPDQTLVNPNPTVTNPSTGVFQAKTKPDQEGDWWWRMEDAAGVVAAEKMFLVRKKRV